MRTGADVMAKSKTAVKCNGQGACADCNSLHELLSAIRDELSLRSDFLGMEQAAALLRCSVDTLRRISEGELPYSRIGRENVYRREDLDRYVRSKRVTKEPASNFVSEVLSVAGCGTPRVVDSKSVDMRGRSSSRRTS